ncbi:MAG: restriction endonuclease subunit S [Clostridia bacterium]|nr:restriction endonuclease subunit S [Clostridia bacterium]
MEKVKLSDIFDLQMGKTPARNKVEYWDGDNQWVSIADLSNSGKYIERTKEYITDQAISESGIKSVPENTVIMSFKLSIGKTAIAKKEIYTNEAIMAFIDKKVYPLDVDYLYHLFSGMDWSEGSNKAVLGLTLNKATLSQKYISIPSLEEQKAIAGKLDKVSGLIEKRKTQLEKLDLLIKSRFIELFGDPVVNPKFWETVPLSSLTINANNGMARRGKDEDGNIVLRLVELQNGFIDYSAPNRISLNETEKKRYELVDNDFLFARVNGNPDYVGRCAVFKSIEEPVFHNDHIIRVHFDETKINGCFMSVLLNSDYGKRQMREQIKTSAGQYTISQDGIGAIMAILPPLELQKQFAAFVEQTDKSKFEIQKSLEKLEILKKSLMQQYFG